MNNFEMTGQEHVKSGVFTLQSELQSLLIVTSKIAKGINIKLVLQCNK